MEEMCTKYFTTLANWLVFTSLVDTLIENNFVKFHVEPISRRAMQIHTGLHFLG